MSFLGPTSQFIKGRFIKFTVTLPVDIANKRINNRTDSPFKGLFFSALSGSATDDTVLLNYSPSLFRGTAIKFKGHWVTNDNDLALEGHISTSLLYKLLLSMFFFAPVYVPLLALLNGNSFYIDFTSGFILFVFSTFISSVFLLFSTYHFRDAVNRIEKLLSSKPTK